MTICHGICRSDPGTKSGTEALEIVRTELARFPVRALLVNCSIGLVLK